MRREEDEDEVFWPERIARALVGSGDGRRECERLAAPKARLEAPAAALQEVLAQLPVRGQSRARPAAAERAAAGVERVHVSAPTRHAKVPLQNAGGRHAALGAVVGGREGRRPARRQPAGPRALRDACIPDATGPELRDAHSGCLRRSDAAAVSRGPTGRLCSGGGLGGVAQVHHLSLGSRRRGESDPAAVSDAQ